MKYYDGRKLMSMKDLGGGDPEIFIATSNRSAGKTTFFNKLFVEEFLAGRGKFILLFRWKHEISDVAGKFFKEIGRLFFHEAEMTEKTRGKGAYHELFLNGESCGYAIAINSSEQVKKFSHLMADADRIIFDEFQPETGRYCPDELNKFISIHTSLARGGGSQVRYLPVYMLSNYVSLINPYYQSLGISKRVRKDTKFLRGDGYVCELAYYGEVAKLQQSSAFNRAFSNESYTSYANENVYLNDNYTFIEKTPPGGYYLCTVKHEGRLYGFRQYRSNNTIHVSPSVDESCTIRYCATIDDLTPDYINPSAIDSYLTTFKSYFHRGLFRFADLNCKNCVLDFIGGFR